MIKLVSPLRCASCQLRGACHAPPGNASYLERHLESLRTACRRLRQATAASGILLLALVAAFAYLRLMPV